MKTLNHGEAIMDAESILRLDAYTSDDVFIGSVSGLLPLVEEGAQAISEIHTDPIGPDGRVIGPRHALINGTGTVIQSTLIVTLESLIVDLPGRRVIVPMTVAELEAMPKHNPASADPPEPNA